MESKKEKKWKLNYDFEKAVLFFLLVLILTASLGYSQADCLLKMALDILLVICIPAAIIFAALWLNSYKKLRNFYK